MPTAYRTTSIGSAYPQQQIQTAPQPRTTEHREGKVARAIETQTTKMPSDWFLWAAIGSLLASLVFQMTQRRGSGNFAGVLGPMLLILGLYNKLVKIGGSDRWEARRTESVSAHW